MKRLLIKGIILSPLSCFGLILRSRLGMVNMKRNGNIWNFYHVHIYPRISSTCSHISRSEKLWFNGSQNAGWMLDRLHGVCKIPWLSLWSNKVKVGWLQLGSLCLFKYIPSVRQFYPFLNYTSVSRLTSRVKTNRGSHVFIIMQQDKKRKQRNTFISIWPKETGREDWFGRPFLARMRQRCQFTSFSYS